MLFWVPPIFENFHVRAGPVSIDFANAGIGAGCEGLSRVIQIRQVHGL